MAYGDNLLVNPSAETEDMSGWIVTPEDSVTVEENITEETEYLPEVDGHSIWSEQEKIFVLEGPAGDFCFIFASDGDAEMSQILYASDIGTQPESFQFNIKFKLTTEQDLWDNSVLGFSTFKIIYTDNTVDYFLIPLIIGVKSSDRYLFNFWVLVQNICTVDEDKVLDYVEISVKASDFINGLKIDYIELRKEIE
jgi:hypothetical protein